MKRNTLIIGALATAAIVGATAVLSTPGFAHGPRGGWGGGPGWGMEQGYGPGYGMGRGMMGKGHGWGRGKCAMAGQATLSEPLTVDDVRSRIEQRLKWRGNERLKVGKVEMTDSKVIRAEIVTVDDSLVQAIEFDPETGARKFAK